MSDTVIQVDEIWKKYRLGVVGSGTLIHDLNRWWHRLRGKTDPYARIDHARTKRANADFFVPADHGGEAGPDSSSFSEPIQLADDEIWALEDVCFDIRQGELVGIIGRNGAGKSTLLKIFSRVTAPTHGRVRIKGRIASLLEVGTGFHPELTGRENIFLNGAILGMTRNDVRCRMDEIIAFSEVEKYIDTPVKRYSSGMYVRLAFAVAAHLEPEILIVDEVLAVGDLNFQKKCMGKMGDVARGGRTVLFVSHNMPALLNMCHRGILLSEGRNIADGPISDVVRQYIGEIEATGGEVTWLDTEKAPGNDIVRLRAVRIICGGKITSEIAFNQSIRFEIEFENLQPGARLSASVHILDNMVNPVLSSANFPSANSSVDPWFGKPYPAGKFRTTCTLPGNFLNTGSYTLNAILLQDVSNIQVFERRVLTFTVHETGEMRKEYGGHWIGVVRPKLAWQTERLMNQDDDKAAGGLAQERLCGTTRVA